MVSLLATRLVVNASAVLGFGVLFLVCRCVHRLYFHPLAHIPGPRIAALSRAYEFYHDVVRKGKYIWEVEKMHEKYGRFARAESLTHGFANLAAGPVVRISPHEVHIRDPYFYDEIYGPASKKQEKGRVFARTFGNPTSTVATIGHELHRGRRGKLSHFFSKKSVLTLASRVHDRETKLIQRLEDAHRENLVVRLDVAYSALTSDIIWEVTSGVSSGFLEDDDFKRGHREAVDELAMLTHVNRFFPLLAPMLLSLPRWLLQRIRPDAVAILDMRETINRFAREKSSGSQETILDALSDPSVPPQERSPQRIADEAVTLLGAGTETTTRVLTLATYYVFRDKALLLKLRDEIKTVMISSTMEPSWPDLAQLPHLVSIAFPAVCP